MDSQNRRHAEELFDEARALPLALIEALSEKFLPGSYQKVLSKDDVAKVLGRAQELSRRFQQERDAKARGLILPPGM